MTICLLVKVLSVTYRLRVLLQSSYLTGAKRVIKRQLLPHRGRGDEVCQSVGVAVDICHVIISSAFELFGASFFVRSDRSMNLTGMRILAARRHRQEVLAGMC